MASFQAKIDRERPRKKKLSFRSVPTKPVIENSKKIAEKFKKIKNIIMTSFQAKTGWERLRKREKTNYRSDQFLPHQEQKIKKKKRKNSKN